MYWIPYISTSIPMAIGFTHRFWNLDHKPQKYASWDNPRANLGYPPNFHPLPCWEGNADKEKSAGWAEIDPRPISPFLPR